MNKLATSAVTLYSLARSSLFIAEGVPIFLGSRLLSRKPRPTIDMNWMREEAIRLFTEDAENIANGIYPLSVLKPEGVFRHATNVVRVWADAARIAVRSGNKRHKDFSTRAKTFLEDVPDYYRRNFHFQTDGYLSHSSAEIYDTQVELLFQGSAQAMRRLVIPPLKRAKPLRILELACGSGSATEGIAKAFPTSQVTATDLSAPYLAVARKRLAAFPRVDFVRADSADLPFKDETFDAVVSVYQFHEVPLDVRQSILKEAKRVLKPGGMMVVADSLQMDDEPKLNVALEQFPKDYHEPFYKNYVSNPLEALFEEAGFGSVDSSHRMVTKVVSGVVRP